MSAPSLADLSGATLDHVTVDWRNGIVLVTFLASPRMREQYALRFTGILRIEIPRGPSASRVVREVRRLDAPGDAPARLEIALESGEQLRFDAASIAIDPMGG
jgi:hypothetical protein